MNADSVGRLGCKVGVQVWHEYIQTTSVADTLKTLHEKGDRARIIAGATDLLLEMERGVRHGISTLVDVTRIPGLDSIRIDNGIIHIGPLVTHNDCVASDLIRRFAYPLARAAWEVGAPQIRNRGTVAGNLITASPANDTITPLIALGASVTLRSEQGERRIALRDFYQGVRKTILQPGEMLVDIDLPAMTEDQAGAVVKIALRRAQAISLVNAAVVLTLKGHVIEQAAIALGAVAPTIIRAAEAEAALRGHRLTEASIAGAAELAKAASAPIDDIRSSASYRRQMVKVAVGRALRSVRDHGERDGFPEHPILLSAFKGGLGSDRGRSPELATTSSHVEGASIQTTINGRAHTFKSGHDKTLLRLLREEAWLTGTKEGCAEGECGACTVFLDGNAVMSCLVPAPRAHGAQLITIEGLAVEGRLHPLQEAFIQDGAVQCGYCTPGFVMSGAKLLEERPHPSRDEIGQALTGNLCRCTGYYKIIQAVEDASLERVGEPLP